MTSTAAVMSKGWKKIKKKKKMREKKRMRTGAIRKTWKDTDLE